MKKIKLKKGYKYIKSCKDCPCKRLIFSGDEVYQRCNLSDKFIGWRSKDYPEWCELTDS